MKPSIGPEKLVLEAAAIIHQAVDALPAVDKLDDRESRLETVRCAVAMVAPFYSEDALHSWPSSVIIALRWSENRSMNSINKLEQLAGLVFLAGGTSDTAEASEISGSNPRYQDSDTQAAQEHCDSPKAKKYVRRTVNSRLARLKLAAFFPGTAL